jgi:hypothetical protein
MIREPASFPFPGSWALYSLGGRWMAVRLQLVRDGEAMLSIPSHYGVASGNRRVALAELMDPTPLSADERAEMEALRRAVAGRKRPRKSDVARVDALQHRELHARMLADQLAKLNPRYVPEAAAARWAA